MALWKNIGILLIVFTGDGIAAYGVGIGTPNASAQPDATSSTRGLLIP